MIDKILAIVALLGLIAFAMVVPIFVPEPALIILTAGCIGLAGYDFWRELFTEKGSGKADGSS